MFHQSCFPKKSNFKNFTKKIKFHKFHQKKTNLNSKFKYCVQLKTQISLHNPKFQNTHQAELPADPLGWWISFLTSWGFLLILVVLGLWWVFCFVFCYLLMWFWPLGECGFLVFDLHSSWIVLFLYFCKANLKIVKNVKILKMKKLKTNKI